AISTDAVSAIQLAIQVRPEAAVIDAAADGLDAASVVRTVRLESRLRRMPCLLLGPARTDAEILAVEADADDHLPRDASPGDVVARVEDLLRAVHDPGSEEAGFGRRRLLAVDD